MSGSGSLLAHLASRLTGRTETLATEALGYILGRSVAARRALRAMVSEGANDVGEIVSARTEVTGEENERVDLVGFDADGDERVLVEAKFWAGLTDNQPKTGWAEAWFGLNYDRWATERDTPLWLHFIESKHMSLAEVRNRLEGTYFYLPLPVGVEYDAVLESVVGSLEWLAEGLASNHPA